MTPKFPYQYPQKIWKMTPLLQFSILLREYLFFPKHFGFLLSAPIYTQTSIRLSVPACTSRIMPRWLPPDESPRIHSYAKRLNWALPRSHFSPSYHERHIVFPFVLSIKNFSKVAVGRVLARKRYSAQSPHFRAESHVTSRASQTLHWLGDFLREM